MTATTAARSPGAPAQPTAGLARCYRFELVKLASQWRLRALFLACLAVPAAYTAVVSRQTSLPVDAVYGRWMGQSGWAGSLVILVFLGSLVLPLLAAVVGGDVFAVEDRLGTWRHLLVAVRSPGRIFAAKALAALTVMTLLLLTLAASSTAGGLLSVGSRPLPGLDGHPMATGDLAGAVALGWLSIVPPAIAFLAVGLLGSVALGRSPLGLLLPVLVALVLAGVQLLPVPAAVRVASPMNAFLGYRALLADPVQPAPLVVGTAVSLSWAVLATWLAHRLFVRRDFTGAEHDGSGRQLVAGGLLPLTGLVLVTAAVAAVVAPASGSGIDDAKLESALATSFSHLYVRQTDQLHRPPVTAGQLSTTAACDKGGDRVEDVGPGGDWRCVVTWTLPGTTATGSAVYQLDVAADGRYVADGDGPKEVNGYFQVHTATGDVPNPLWQLDGSVDLLAPTTEGTR